MKPAQGRLWALPLAAACALAGATTYAVFYHAQKDSYALTRAEGLTAVANLKSQLISEFHQERVNDLSIYSSHGSGGSLLAAELLAAVNGSAAARARLRPTYLTLLSRGTYESVALMDAKGRLALVLPEGAAPPEPSNSRPRAPRLAGVRRLGDGARIDYEAPVPGDGRLLFRVRPKTAFGRKLLEWPGIGKSAELTVYEVTTDALVAINRFESSPETDARIPLVDPRITGLLTHAQTKVVHVNDFHGAHCLAAARMVPGLDWLVTVIADEKELLAPLRREALLVALAATGLYIASAFAFFIVLRQRDERHRAEADAERRLLAAAIEQAGEAIVITDAAAGIIYTNPAFTRGTGYAREEARGRKPSMLKSGRHGPEHYQQLWKTITEGRTWTGRMINRRKDGSLFEEDAMITPVRDAAGTITHYIAVKRDITAVKSLEEQLQQSQKMEAVGRLAGGVAHDFNNILTTINGYSEMLLAAAPPDSPLASDLSEILGAGRRAAQLTRQLLAFSRRAPITPCTFDLRVHLRGAERLLRRTLGEDMHLDLDLAPAPLWIKADPGQIDQVIMNLAVNARDAMPKGGTLRIKAREDALADDIFLFTELIPAGRYCVLTFKDDGTGMDAGVRSHIFEPFFTTKEKGKGTGLGLATVYGIVKQAKGHIVVDSAPGEGASFMIYLPVSEEALKSDPSVIDTGGAERGDETLLIVEDQDEVLRLTSRILTAQGYRVLACRSGKEALVAAAGTEIDLLLTDVVMPEMSGVELAARLTPLRPRLAVLFMSGYTDGRLDGVEGAAGSGPDLLLKPFTGAGLCRRVRQSLDQRA